MKRTYIEGGRRAYGLAVACVALAAGGIVLLRSEGKALPDEGSGAGLRAAAAGPARIALDGPSLSGAAALTEGAAMAHGTRQVFLDLRLEAGEPSGPTRRVPVSVAVVLDTSGSMSGTKMEEARRAVAELARRMRDEDEIAIVTYNDHATLFEPLVRVGAVRAELGGRVMAGIEAGGGTNIPEGLLLGHDALARAQEGHIKRVVLVSDGLDHSGRNLATFCAVVQDAAERGATTSSLGIGTDYDERFLMTMADAGRGNYAFLAQGRELGPFLEVELDQAGSAVAKGVYATFDLPPGVRLAAAYGALAEGDVGRVAVPLGTFHAGARRKVLLELLVPAGAPGTEHSIGVDLSYTTVADGRAHTLGDESLVLRSVSREDLVLASRDAALHADALATVAHAQQARAMEAWRTGRRDEADRFARSALGLVGQAEEVAPAGSAVAAKVESQKREVVEDKRMFDKPAAAPEAKRYRLYKNAERHELMGTF